MSLHTRVAAVGVTFFAVALFLGSPARARAEAEAASPEGGASKFTVTADLSFCEEPSALTLQDAAVCLEKIRGNLNLASPDSQGYAHFRPVPNGLLKDKAVLACLGVQEGDARARPSDEKVRRCARRVLEDQRNYITSALAAEARAAEQRISALKKDVESEEDPQGKNLAAIQEKRAEIDALQVARNFIGRTISLPDCSSLFVDHRCYESWFANFSAGGEYNSVNEILGEKLLPRTGVLIYRNYSSYERWRRLHFFGEFRLAGAGESASIGDVPGLGDGETSIAAAAEDGGEEPAEPEPAPEPEIEKALDARGAVFFPLIKIGAKVRQERKLQELIGPIVEVGIRKVDKTDEVDKRYYTGFRMSFNPEWYLDVLYGKTESLQGRRFEVRGQMPVIPVKTGNHVYIGAVANFGATNEDAGDTPQKDTVQVYLTWNVDFKSIFGK